jgi:uncharacterized protein (DUF924 family)
MAGQQGDKTIYGPPDNLCQGHHLGGRQTVTSHTPAEILCFWFPPLPEKNLAAIARRAEWWFRGGTDAEIVERFASLPEQAERGELNAWAQEAHSRLALILVADQFTRTVYRSTARAYALDPKARALTREGIPNGHYAALPDPWQKTFFLLPLGHSESLDDLETAVKLAEALTGEARDAEEQRMLEFSAGQARGHRDVIARFGRQPHRNEVLGRASTAEELEYLGRGQRVHLRQLPR